jgi:hypothetical protein
MLAYLLSQKGLDSVSDFLARQTTTRLVQPPHSEVVWPLPTRLFPYE